jgi:hypothetical protein
MLKDPDQPQGEFKMNEKEIQRKAEDLVSQVEKGSNNSLSDELNNLSPQDRLAVAREMDKINFEHRLQNRNLPDIQIGVGSSGHEASLLDMRIRKAGKDTDIYNPKTETDKSLYKGASAYMCDDNVLQLWGFPDGKMILEYPYSQGRRTVTDNVRLPADVAWTAVVDGVQVVKHKDGRVVRTPQK